MSAVYSFCCSPEPARSRPSSLARPPLSTAVETEAEGIELATVLSSRHRRRYLRTVEVHVLVTGGGCRLSCSVSAPPCQVLLPYHDTRMANRSRVLIATALDSDPLYIVRHRGRSQPGPVHHVRSYQCSYSYWGRCNPTCACPFHGPASELTVAPVPPYPLYLALPPAFRLQSIFAALHSVYFSTLPSLGPPIHFPNVFPSCFTRKSQAKTRTYRTSCSAHCLDAVRQPRFKNSRPQSLRPGPSALGHRSSPTERHRPAALATPVIWALPNQAAPRFRGKKHGSCCPYNPSPPTPAFAQSCPFRPPSKLSPCHPRKPQLLNPR